MKKIFCFFGFHKPVLAEMEDFVSHMPDYSLFELRCENCYLVLDMRIFKEFK